MSFCDLDSSTADYATRFRGAVGEWFLEVQRNAIVRCVKKITHEEPRTLRALDIGGGHAQCVKTLTDIGFKTTLLVSEDAAVGQAEPYIASGKVALVVDNPLKLPFPDKSFDIVTSLRILPHTDEWKTLIAEMSRVSRRGVIIDYPTTQSINAFSEMLFGLKKNIEKNTRPFSLFSKNEVRDEFLSQGFEVRCSVGQFVLPMALYRAIKVKAFAKTVEGVLRPLGLHILGSPVVEGYSCK